MRWRWPRFWVDNFRGFNYNLTWQERRNLVLGRVEGGGFGWWIVFVAGLGFMSDAYDIFAINTVMPMLGTVYWEGEVPVHYQLAINVSTLLGSMIGQVVFGILADIYGRRKMYGLELIVTIVASLGFAASSTGVNNSMSIIAWLIFYRLLMGVSIGADYPLSGVITAEFAPTKYRGRMIAAVFFFQPFGQLLATLLALAATEGFRKHILSNQDPSSCPGYPLTSDGKDCACSVYSLTPEGKDCARTVDRIWRLVSALGAIPAALAIISRLTIPESVYWVLDVKNDSNQAMQTRDYWPLPLLSHNGRLMDGESMLAEDFTLNTSRNMVKGEAQYRGDANVQDISPDTISPLPGDANDLGPPALGIQMKNFPEAHHQHSQTEITSSYEDPHPLEQSRKDFREYLFGSKTRGTKGNWSDLFATSINWMLLDFTFYLLGVNSSRLIPNMFNTPGSQGPYPKLIDIEWHTLVATSVGAVIGGAIAIKIMNKFSRKKIQMWGFLGLAGLFVLVGVLYITLLKKDGSGVIVAIYVLCQLLFNVGPNTTTFIIPAEAFPTRYRCTCHGISAASGKLGSVLGQILITRLVDEKTHDNRVGYLLIAFFIVMVLGAIVTKYMTPETCDIYGKSRTLEELSHGKAYRDQLTREEKDREEEFRKNSRRGTAS